MNKRHLFLGLLTSLGMVGVAVGGAFNANPIKAEAATGDYTSGIQLIGDALGVGWTNTANTAYQFVEQTDGTFAWTGAFTVERFRAVVPGSYTTALNWDNVVATSEKVADSTFVKASTVGSDGDNNIWCKTAGTYKLVLDSGKTKLSIITAGSELTKFDISEYAVVDGAKEASAFATEKAIDGYTFTPNTVIRSNYSFDGWYTDELCTSAYTATTWTANGSLYAKYTTLTDRTVYFQTVTGWTDTYVYSFGGTKQYGAWPGTKLTAVTNGVNYQSLGGIFTVSFDKSYSDTSFIFNDGNGGTKGTAQSYDLKIADKAFYWLAASDGSTGDADKGAAAKVVYDINVARKAVAASTGILAESICGISKATATTLVDEYDALNATAKGYADAATDYVYDYPNTGSGNNVSIATIVGQLRTIANKPVTSPSSFVVDQMKDQSGLIVAIVCLSLGLAGASFLLLKRKKHN